MNTVQDIMDTLKELKEGTGVPLNIKNNIEEITLILLDPEDSIEAKKNKTHDLLENMSNDTNIDSHIRTMIYTLSNWIESLDSNNGNSELQTYINKRLTKKE